VQLFFPYGPQAPTAFCNGPTCAELQGNWFLQMMDYMRKQGLGKIEAQRKKEDEWREKVMELAYASLLPMADSVSLATDGPAMGEHRD
jgi:hypothetical protein